MDIGKLKTYSNLAHDLAQTKKNALEKCKARQIIAYNGRLFRADAQTINVVSTFKAHNKKFIMLDVNDNPILIENLADFKDIILDRYTTSTLEYYEEYQKLKKSRSVEKLIEV